MVINMIAMEGKVYLVALRIATLCSAMVIDHRNRQHSRALRLFVWLAQ